MDPSHQVRATSTLAPEFEFEYSRDEGDMNAERYLGSIDHYGDEDATAGTLDPLSACATSFSLRTPRNSTIQQP